MIIFCVARAGISRPAPLTRDPRCRPTTRAAYPLPALFTRDPRWLDDPKISSHAFLIRLMSEFVVVSFWKLFRLFYDLKAWL